MKPKFIVLAITLLFATMAHSQEIKASQFIALSDKSLGEVQEYLTANNWYFYQAAEERKGTFGNARFVYDVPNYKPGDLAYYLFTYYYSEVGSAQALEITFNDPTMYKNFNDEIASSKYKLSSSSIKGENILKVYKKGSQIIELTIPPNFDGGKGYKFLFAKRSSYKKIRNR